MRLPNVDQYRQPFVEPLGYLTLLAARVDLLMTDCIAIIFAGSDPHASGSLFEKAADRIRHWVAADSRKGLSNIGLLDAHAQDLIHDCLERYGKLKESRNRYVHDAVEVGWDSHEGVSLLKIGFPKVQKKTSYSVESVTPDDIAALACEFGELRADLDLVRSMLLKAWYPDK